VCVLLRVLVVVGTPLPARKVRLLLLLLAWPVLLLLLRMPMLGCLPRQAPRGTAAGASPTEASIVGKG
jgi:hypothetical protein